MVHILNRAFSSCQLLVSREAGSVLSLLPVLYIASVLPLPLILSGSTKYPNSQENISLKSSWFMSWWCEVSPKIAFLQLFFSSSFYREFDTFRKCLTAFFLFSKQAGTWKPGVWKLFQWWQYKPGWVLCCTFSGKDGRKDEEDSGIHLNL